MAGDKTKKMPSVAVAYPVAVPWMALFVRGVADYAERHGGWNLTTSPPTLAGAEEIAQTVYNLRGWPGDGVIAAVRNPAEAQAARRLSVPVVNISSATKNTNLPRVLLDNAAVGRLAAEHLLERGHRRLAYYGIRGLWYSEQRCLGFRHRAEQAGIECEIFESDMPSDARTPWRRQVAPLVGWLRGLKTPIGLMAAQDYRARVVLDECLRLGRNVPHDVAILGVDNDPTVCEFCRPMLSSVSRNAWQMGFEAAALLDSLMQGHAAPTEAIFIQPDGVVARQSTDTVAIDDPALAAAVHFMRDHLAEPFGIAQLMRHMTISRRQLELRFRRAFQCTPLEYLCRLRINRAKTLLAGPERQKLHNIAAACGFSDEARLRLVFRHTVGMTPSEYRKQ